MVISQRICDFTGSDFAEVKIVNACEFTVYCLTSSYKVQPGMLEGIIMSGQAVESRSSAAMPHPCEVTAVSGALTASLLGALLGRNKVTAAGNSPFPTIACGSG